MNARQPTAATHAEVLAEMMAGYPSLEALRDGLPLGPMQRLRVVATDTAASIRHRARHWLPGASRRAAAHAAALAARQDLRMQSRHPDPAALARRGGHHLDADEIAAFERDGVLGPFDVIPPGEARRLARYCEDGHDSGDFATLGVFPRRIRDALERSGTWDIQHSGLFQAHRARPLWDVLSSPAITHRVASLLGDDVLCWRSQLFAKRPGAPGTFWHQAALFRETSTGPKLRPPVHCPPGLVQLTAWFALRDVTIATGALRMLPGSHTDGRLEYAYTHAQDATLAFLSNVSPALRRTALPVGLFAADDFGRSRAVFACVLDQLGPVFDGLEVRDLTMWAGQAVLFTSLNVHDSHPNTTADQTRLALAGRYTAADVAVTPDGPIDHLPTPTGDAPFSLARVPPLVVLGRHDPAVNPVALAGPLPETTVLRDEA